jgi:hypothetical protein
MADYLDTSDNGLLAFATPYSAQITSTPTAFGLTAGQATTLSSAVSAYATKLAAAQDPTTRGPAAVLAKDLSKKALIAEIRATARQVQGTQSVTDAQRQALGLNIRHARTPIGPPAMEPMLDIVGVNGRTFSCKVHAEEGSRRSFPAGVKSVFIFMYVGATAPEDPSLYVFMGTSTRTTFDVQVPLSVAAGAQVWITAAWANPRNQTGPACTPVGVKVQYGSAVAA